MSNVINSGVIGHSRSSASRTLNDAARCLEEEEIEADDEEEDIFATKKKL
jgi:hypothetical protein